jgi:hypothetical protein
MPGSHWPRCQGVTGHDAGESLATMPGSHWPRCQGVTGHDARESLATMPGGAAHVALQAAPPPHPPNPPACGSVDHERRADFE